MHVQRQTIKRRRTREATRTRARHRSPDPWLVRGVRAGRHAGRRPGTRPDRLWRQRRSARHERPQRGDRASTRAWMPTTAGPSRRPSSAIPNAVEFRVLTADQRATAIQGGEVDVIFRNTTNTLQRDAEWGDFGPTIFYDGQGMMVNADARRDQPGGPRRRLDLRDLGHHDRAQPGRPDGFPRARVHARRVGRDRHRLRAVRGGPLRCGDLRPIPARGSALDVRQP